MQPTQQFPQPQNGKLAFGGRIDTPILGICRKRLSSEYFSPEGGTLIADGYSDPEDPSQYSAHDILSLGFKKSAKHAALLENTAAIDKIKLADYDGIFLTGGQSPMVTFIDNAKLHKLVADFYEVKKVVGIVCHATCVLLKTKTSDGKLITGQQQFSGVAAAKLMIEALEV